MNERDFEIYNKAKKKAYAFFQMNKRIWSACLGMVTLNSDGFMHLIKKDHKHTRPWKEQLKRFELLHFLIVVLEGMRFHQEYQKTQQPKIIKRNKTTLIEFKAVQYWCFIAVIKNKIRIKIILKKTGNGKIIFWSIVPAWKLKGYKPLQKIILSKGSPEND